MLLDHNTHRTPLVLRDGTPFEALIDHEQYEVSMRVLLATDHHDAALEARAAKRESRRPAGGAAADDHIRRAGGAHVRAY